MKALAWLSLVLTVLVGADGIYMTAAHYQPKDVNNFNLSDGGTVVVAAVFLLIVTVIAFMAASRAQAKQQAARQRADAQSPTEIGAGR